MIYGNASPTDTCFSQMPNTINAVKQNVATYCPEVDWTDAWEQIMMRIAFASNNELYMNPSNVPLPSTALKEIYDFIIEELVIPVNLTVRNLKYIELDLRDIFGEAVVWDVSQLDVCDTTPGNFI